ncbi:MAG: hypothetical protein U5K30_03190 [Acidimicrobiales bacterium]|nr:hypothetical protein [Acidimicrobiales bacterium]
MTLLTTPLHLLALVLVISGADKLGDPTPATTAMRETGLPGVGTAPWPGRVLGVIEVGVGGAVLAFGGPVAAGAMVATYLSFGVFLVLLQRRAAEDVGCGCFGASSAPPGPVHLVIDAAAAGVALAAVILGAPDLVAVVDEGAVVLITHVLLVVTGAALVVASSSVMEDVKHRRELLRT